MFILLSAAFRLMLWSRRSQWNELLSSFFPAVAAISLLPDVRVNSQMLFSSDLNALFPPTTENSHPLFFFSFFLFFVWLYFPASIFSEGKVVARVWEWVREEERREMRADSFQLQRNDGRWLSNITPFQMSLCSSQVTLIFPLCMSGAAHCLLLLLLLTWSPVESRQIWRLETEAHAFGFISPAACLPPVCKPGSY